MFYKIKSIKPLDDMLLEVLFENGIIKKYDLKMLFEKRPEFKKLQEKSFMNKICVDVGGYGISWDETLDISCNELWENGV